MVPASVNVTGKRTAIGCYQSQLTPLRRDHSLDERLDANVPEQFWSLSAPPAGWKGLVDA